MRVLATGATGFIGAALVPALAAQGVEVTPAPRALLDEIVRGGFSLRGFDAVLHLAGAAHARAPEALHMQANAALTIALGGRARDAGVARFVFASSVKALGERSGPGPFEDATRPAPKSAYGRSKLRAEQGLAGLQGLNWAALRLPLVHGADAKGNFALLLRLADTPLPLPFEGVGNLRNVISLESAVAALIAAALTPEGPGGAFCVCDRPALSTADIAANLRAGLDRPSRLVRAGPVLPLLSLRPLRALIDSLEVDDARFRRFYGYGGRGDIESGAALQETARRYADARRRAR